jgi:hypothetical protein
MRPPILLAAVLAGCLNLTAQAEAHDRHGQPARQLRSFDHQSIGHQSFARQPFGRPSFAPGRHAPWFTDRRSPRWSGPPSDIRGFAPPHHGPHFAQGQPARRLPQRRHVQRFVGPIQGPPFSRLPGRRVLAGRPIPPFVGRPVRLARPLVVVRRPRHPTFVRVFPSPAFPRHHDGFSSPHAPGGLTIILRDPGFTPPW